MFVFIFVGDDPASLRRFVVWPSSDELDELEELVQTLMYVAVATRHESVILLLADTNWRNYL